MLINLITIKRVRAGNEGVFCMANENRLKGENSDNRPSLKVTQRRD